MQTDADFRRVLLRAATPCFASGALVFEMPNATVESAFRACRVKRRLGWTHKLGHPTSAQMEYHFQPPLVICGHVKRIALMYMTQDPGGTRYCFVKLERSPGMSVQHAQQAVLYYLLGRSERSSLPTRRETDPWRASDCARSSVACRRYNARLRKGSEVFVPRPSKLQA